VAEGHGPQAHPILYVLIAVGVPHVRAVTSSEHGCHVFGVLIRAAGVSVCATRHQLVQTTLQRCGGCESVLVGVSHLSMHP